MDTRPHIQNAITTAPIQAAHSPRSKDVESCMQVQQYLLRKSSKRRPNRVTRLGSYDVRWIELAQDHVQWRAVSGFWVITEKQATWRIIREAWYCGQHVFRSLEFSVRFSARWSDKLRSSVPFLTPSTTVLERCRPVKTGHGSFFTHHFKVITHNHSSIRNYRSVTILLKKRRQ
jgi:hypothetical protein